MIKRFIIVWLLYWAIYMLQPVSSIYSGIFLAFIIQFIFVFAVVLAYGFSNIVIAQRISCLIEIKEFNNKYAINIIKIGIFISITGIIFLFINKVIIQGVNYFDGIGAARHQMTTLTEEGRGAVSSIYSAIGYPISSAYFISAMLIFSPNLLIKDNKRMALILIISMLLIINSILVGGRSAILLALTFLTFPLFLEGKRKLFNNRNYYKFLGLVLFILFIYIIYIFNSRASVNNIDLRDYSMDFLEYLGLVPYEWFSRVIEHNYFGETLAILNLALSYMTHSISTIAGLLDDKGAGYPVFNYLITLLEKLKFINPTDVDWPLSGRFMSLPGGIYFIWGFLGLLVFSILIGILVGIILNIFRKNTNSISMFFLCSIFESILLSSPFIFAGDLIFFPFIISGGLLTLFIARIIKIL